MTVRELIDALSEYNDDMQVLIAYMPPTGNLVAPVFCRRIDLKGVDPWVSIETMPFIGAPGDLTHLMVEASRADFMRQIEAEIAEEDKEGTGQ
jgi:hypothetical protein